MAIPAGKITGSRAPGLSSAAKVPVEPSAGRGR